MIVVMGDFNEDVRKGAIHKASKKRKIHDIIINKHNKDPSATFNRNTKKANSYYIWKYMYASK